MVWVLVWESPQAEMEEAEVEMEELGMPGAPKVANLVMEMDYLMLLWRSREREE